MKRLRENPIIIVVALVVAIALGSLGTMVLANVNEQYFTVRVTDKMRVSYGRIWNTHKYLVFTLDEETDTVQVFENTDTTPYLKFNSSDFYARITVGKTYTFRTVGLRLPFLSMYRNIIGLKEVEEVE